MASIYISSTYTDLQSYRASSIAVLRKAGHSTEAMEDYVASGQYPPLKKCLDDVSKCDYYVGIFAWRYGYIPSQDNPLQKSITELEFRKASEMRKPQFIFLLDVDADWLEEYRDTHTGEGNAGNRVKEFRGELGESKLASFFRTPDELASLVTAAISKWETDKARRQQQHYAESEDLEEIVFDARHIESLNKYLRLAQDIQNEDIDALTENQISYFRRLKEESWEVAQLNKKIKKLDQKAQSLVLDIRIQLDTESQTIAREISKNDIDNVSARQLELYERIRASVGEFERDLECGKQVAHWLKSERQSLVDDGLLWLTKELVNQPILSQEITNAKQGRVLRRETEQYLRRLAVASSLGRTNLLDSAHGLNESSKEIYMLFFEYIKTRKVRTTSGLLDSQKDLLITYIDHLISHVFTDL